ncbi:capsular polysaccharide export protein, LipB/KpsS family [Candidatus Contubernalis alkaliaceticus]|uniref:capsular polysaccharide export protein, LipB/KpsS family n=1 Tax=Candidatus Contubernalis alkaliaceticus TaxID=338645 RepID=UPI001F4BF0DE|nr:hypothetical protein [Candidatus Contubernalis alkalaceticus]UNC93561.1 hypothetical protein HUE98_16650 [Candidatus Contubernalis alkalaceticus]
MKIGTISYYGSFARYFHYLKKNVSRIYPEACFYNISIYPTAHIYWNSKKEHSVFLTSEVSKIKAENLNGISNTYKGINLNDVMSYHLKVLDIEKGSKEYAKLKDRTIRHIDYFDNLFATERFDILICSGDTRMFIEVAILLAHRYDVKVYFFEQGPYRTTIIDEQGVNVNSSFRTQNLVKKTDVERVSNFINREKNAQFNPALKFYFYKLFDVLLLSPPLRSFFPLELIAERNYANFLWRNIRRFIKKNSSLGSTKEMPSKSILLILQVPYDAQMIYNSPHFSNFFQMVRVVNENIPSGYSLVVREHPLFKGSYEDDMYRYIAKHDIPIINDKPLSEMILQSDLVIVNNSTVGLEALSFYKPLVILGDSYYDSHGVGYKVNSPEEIKVKIKEALVNKVPQEQIDIFLYNLLFEYLYEGHFQDEVLKDGHKIALQILKDFFPSKIEKDACLTHEK